MAYVFVLLALLLSCNAALASNCTKDRYSFPIIDFHTHAFNLRYLPIKQIMYSHKIPKVAADLIAKIAINSTPSYDPNRVSSPTTPTTNDPAAAIRKLTTDLNKSLELKQIESTLWRAIIRGAKKETGNSDRTFTKHREQFQSKRQGNRSNYATEHAITILKKTLGIKGSGSLLTTLGILMMREDHIMEYLMNHEYCETDVFVHHMMDLQHVYAKQAVTIPIENQFKVVKRIADDHKGRVIFFGAFDPFRSLSKGSSMAMIDMAVQYGAQGVKFYPPSGYRPSDMVIPAKPTSTLKGKIEKCWIGPQLKNQWKYRYKNRTVAEFNKLNQKFCDYSSNFSFINPQSKSMKGLPVFSHHTPAGFEADKYKYKYKFSKNKVKMAYGELFADPYYWLPLLKKNEDFKLILGHSGGGGGWFSDRDEIWRKSFSRHAATLCMLYKNVYCDFGMLSEIFEADNKKALTAHMNTLVDPGLEVKDARVFRRNLEKLWEAKDLDGLSKLDYSWQYKMTDKMLYGSDWMMISQEKGYRDYVSSFSSIFDSLQFCGIKRPCTACSTNLASCNKKEQTRARRNFFYANAEKLLEIDVFKIRGISCNGNVCIKP